MIWALSLNVCHLNVCFLTPHTQLIAVIYRPPKCNTHFLTEFAEFLGDVTLKNDKLLVLGDFNVHVWCMNDHLAKEFTHLQNAFDFSIGVNARTHKGGHIPDWVLLHGLSVTDLEVCENGFSYHKTVMFTVSCSAAAPIVLFHGRLKARTHRDEYRRVIRQRFSTCFLCSHTSYFRWRWAEWTCKFIPWH